MSNVINLGSWAKAKKSQKKAQTAKPATTERTEPREHQVFDISQKRQETLKADRRTVRRTVLTEFVSMHCVVPGAGLIKVLLHDLNEKGMSFDLDQKFGHFKKGEEIALRLYINHQTYVPFTVEVKHVSYVEDEGSHRHGTALTQDSLNNVALHHFVKFLESVSLNLKDDRGDIIVSKINL